ncbi:1-acyl-sn-glycerol-3-phosphate acyltransferase [Clostridium bowmanii]|uniref:lysophospholipid acyltransferase family protein n=1 Tax=Clostridium bowmanii TaxID=132925 RepID=UPI001C0E6A7A|nr:lysophospholipid acyltransferase family protein [Clostridium bowmanii]MBU3189833.1 1-acyl-sn-glycerol-3-phosphate acyltransferase [Clostridium bowmanii]MCA1074317.1 1-acyl-sn-glycerol-3-phosphate acyltransferase [Clostridium bowmanii]
MIKLLWYLYFSIYLCISSVSFIEIKYIARKSPKEAEIYAYRRAQKISRYVLKVTNTSMKVSGIENIPVENCVFISNHQAIFDGFALVACIDKPFGFIAKKEIKKIPLISTWLRSIGSIYINRQSTRESIKTIQEAVEKINGGSSMLIFPEGTRSLKSKMNSFKKGSIKLATKSKTCIVPITIDGSYNVLEASIKVMGNNINMVIHKPIYVNSLSRAEEQDLAEYVQNIIEDELNNMVLKKIRG